LSCVFWSQTIHNIIELFQNINQTQNRWITGLGKPLNENTAVGIKLDAGPQNDLGKDLYRMDGGGSSCLSRNGEL
jgi:hypothetical protein